MEREHGLGFELLAQEPRDGLQEEAEPFLPDDPKAEIAMERRRAGGRTGSRFTVTLLWRDSEDLVLTCKYNPMGQASGEGFCISPEEPANEASTAVLDRGRDLQSPCNIFFDQAAPGNYAFLISSRSRSTPTDFMLLLDCFINNAKLRVRESDMIDLKAGSQTLIQGKVNPDGKAVVALVLQVSSEKRVSMGCAIA